MSNIFDNISQQTLEGLLGALSNPNAKRADFCVGYFNLRGWKELVDAVEHLPGEKIVEDEDEVFRTCRLIVGMHSEPLSEVKRIYRKVSEGGKMDNATANLLRTQMALEFRKQLTVGVPTNEDEMGLKKLISQLKSGKLVVKLYLESPLHAKLYIVHEDHHSLPATSILGSSNLTLSGLRFQKELNYQTNQKGDNELLIDWFNARWEEQYCIDISKELIEVLENSWASEVPLAPYYIYLFMIYNLCEEARLGAAQYEIPSTFKSILFPYQEAAVKLAAKKLDNRGGVLLGDVVGLGKTMTACAILKMYEAFEDRYALVICPPKLVDMWNQYRKDFDIKIDVISSGSIDTRSMEKLKPYKTVVIDESHNFRNQEGMRYKALRSYLLDNAEKTILLTATPYNKSYLDISGQLKLFIQEDKQLGISPETLIAHLGGIDEFITQHGDIDPQTILAFEESLYSADWQELMRRYMIRRTRSFIKEVHCKRDEDRNRFYLPHQDGSRSYFPERLARRVLFKIDPADPFDIYAGLYSRPVVDSLNQLHLPRYGLSTYIQEKEAEKASKEQARILEDLSKAGGRMRGFARTNLMKRLESSGHAFLLSLYRHALRNHIFAYAIDNGLDIPIGNSSPFDMDDYLEDNDPALFVVDEEQEKVRIYPFEEAFFKERAQKAYSMLANKSDRYYRYYRWIDPRFFTPTLKTNLLQDAKAIRALIEKGHHWNAEKDAKFDALVNLICETHPNEKMVIFSQFADTVEKINERLVASGLENVDWITGSHGEQYSVVGRFSPKSNRYRMARHERETRVLITSDVLSEGQNLQDAHIVVNFDLPWAIIRLIQRAGRVDRIGQDAPDVFCYSFFPADGIEELINLRGRLLSRITENQEAVGADEQFFEDQPMSRREVADLYDGKSNVLEDEADAEDVDLTSYALQIWKKAIAENPKLENEIPLIPKISYSAKRTSPDIDKPGVLSYIRTGHENDVLAWLDAEGKTVTNSQIKILQSAMCHPDEPAFPKAENHHDLVAQAIELANTEAKSSAGVLGKANTVRSRIYKMMKAHADKHKGTLFEDFDLELAVDAIYKKPLRIQARDTLARMLKQKATADQIATTLREMLEHERLVVPDDELEDQAEPQIICSLGLV